MTTKTPVFFLLLLSTVCLAVADDLTLQNGTVYHVIEVDGSDYGHILVNILDGGLTRQVWIPLSLLTQEQITSLKDSKKKRDDELNQAEQMRSMEDKVKTSGCILSGQIEAFVDNGVIADASLIDVTEYSPAGFILHSSRGPAQIVYIAGSVGKDMVSGDTFQPVTVYSIGVFEQSGQRYRAYTTDIDSAVKYWIKSQQSQASEPN